METWKEREGRVDHQFTAVNLHREVWSEHSCQSVHARVMTMHTSSWICSYIYFRMSMDLSTLMWCAAFCGREWSFAWGWNSLLDKTGQQLPATAGPSPSAAPREIVKFKHSRGSRGRTFWMVSCLSQCHSTNRRYISAVNTDSWCFHLVQIQNWLPGYLLSWIYMRS